MGSKSSGRQKVAPDDDALPDIHAPRSSRVSDEEARAFCREVEAMRKSLGVDLITAEHVYTTATASPKVYPACHAWLTRLAPEDAARKWYLKEAAELLSIVRTYSVVRVNGERASVREYVHVAGSTSDTAEYVGPGYCPRKEMLASRERRELFVARQKSDLHSWCQRNVDISELDALRLAILKLLARK